MGTYEDMELFLKIVESGSITKTADQMQMAKSAVSKKLSDLENRIGVQLLNRTTRKSSLTEAGHLFYNQSQKILQDTEEMMSSVRKEKTTLSGSLKVAAPLSFGIRHLSPIVSQFAKSHPDLVIDLHFSDSQVNLVEQGIDIAIRIANLEDSNLVARKFTIVRHVLCASPAYLEEFGEPQSPQDLRHHKILRYRSPTGLTHRLTDNEGKAHEIQGRTAMLSNNGDFLRQSAVDGLGLYFSPTFICHENIVEGKLQPILCDYTTLELGAYAVYPQTKFLSSRVRLFIDHLVTSFGPDPYWDQIPG